MQRVERLTRHLTASGPRPAAAAMLPSSNHTAAKAPAAPAAAAAAAAGLNIAVSTHVLNTSNGLPAANMLVTFQAQSSSSSSSDSQSWVTLGSERTNADGRISSFPPIVVGAGVASASYRLLFESADYFAQQGITPAFFPQITLQVT